MPGFSNVAENDLLLLLFNNTAWANVGNAGGILGSSAAGQFFISLHTATLDDTSLQNTTEANYTGYARIGVNRSSAGFGVSGTAPTQAANAGLITFGACTAGSSTCTYFAVGRDSSGAGEIIMYGALTASLAVSVGITPEFAINALVCTLD